MTDEAGASPRRSADRPSRPILEHVVCASSARNGWVKIVLRWPNGATTAGAAKSSERREARAHAAASALAKALQPALEARGARIELDHVFIHRLAGRDSVLVRGLYDAPVKKTHIAGAAVIKDDVASAAARAFLHAVNRPLTHPFPG